MTQVQIKALDPIYCQVIEGRKLLEPCLSYPAEYWQQGQYRKVRKPYRKKLIEKGGLFLTGFLPKVEDYCKTNEIACSVDYSNMEYLYSEQEPHVEGKNLKEGEWDFQYPLIKTACEEQRGVIKAATGTGKTVLMVGILSCFPSAKALFLTNTYVPISQFEEELIEQNRENISSVDISTIQSFYKKDPNEYATKYDIILIDECHEGMGFRGKKNVKGKQVDVESMYHKVLTNSLSPVRLGFTATLPGTVEGKWALEGLLGPVIGELTIQEGTERGVLSRVKLMLKEVPFNQSVKDLRKYQDVYKAGVVNSKSLNRLIIQDAIEDVDKGRSVLILITEIKHGENLLEMADLYGFPLVFVQGKTEKEIRDQVRHSMIDMKIEAIVATAVFRKSLNIPSLGSIINGCQGKSETMTLQIIGRGLRAAEGKEVTIIRDYFNPSHYYLISHFGYRLSLYFREKWLGEEED